MSVYNLTGDVVASGEGKKGYVTSEANRVAQLVRNVQNEKTLTMIGISDLHYRNDNSTIKAAIEDMSEGMKELHNQIHVDYDIGYGDVIYAMWAADGLSTRIGYDEGVIDANNVAKLIQNGIGFHKQIQLVGNHDPNATDSSGNKWFDMDMLYSYFGEFNENGERPTNYRNRGYGLIDDDYRKVRIIYLNTSDFASGSPNKNTYGNLNYYMSAEQVEWLINALDLSEKDNASQWQIILMSHVPFDQSSTYLEGGMVKNGYPNLLYDYENGNSGVLLGKAYDFSNGKNAAKLALFIHGHTHSFTVDNQHYRAGTSDNYTYPTMKMPRISVPQALPGRETSAKAVSDVGIDWGVGETFPKTANTKNSTTFVVNTLDPANMIIYSHHYGAGIDRILNYNSVTVSENYTVTPNITPTGWYTLNSSIATVSNGVVTPVANGNVLVYAKSSDGTREYWNISVSL